MSRPLIMLFGGQSSRDLGIFDRLEAVAPRIGAHARARASHYAGGDPTDFSSNKTIQVSVLAATLGWLELVNAAGLQSTASAGLSLGEYAHLVDLGALPAEGALEVVAARGALYDRGPDGAMAAIFPAAWEELRPLVERVAAAHGGARALAPAVFNSPSQTVVAGSRTALDALIEAADEELFARGVIVEERIPMHTPRFEPVAAPFRAVLQSAQWTGRARVSYRANVSGRVADPDRDTVIDHLTRHVYQPVHWRTTVDALASEYHDAVFLEVGPRTVLRDLMLRRWHPGRAVFAIDDPDAGPEQAWERATATVAAVKRALHDAEPPVQIASVATGHAR